MNGENNLFSFNPLMSEEVVKTIYSLKKDHYDVTLYQLKLFSGSFLPYLTGVINLSIATSSFLDELKSARVISAFK